MELASPTIANDSLLQATTASRQGLPLAEVAAVETRRFSVKRTLMLFPGIPGGLIIFGVAASIIGGSACKC